MNIAEKVNEKPDALPTHMSELDASRMECDLLKFQQAAAALEEIRARLKAADEKYQLGQTARVDFATGEIRR